MSDESRMSEWIENIQAIHEKLGSEITSKEDLKEEWAGMNKKEKDIAFFSASSTRAILFAKV